ncbi:hypothetical protein [Pseudodonghicola flavimaris]|uniref:GNAT family N-acetyltransferase n=1 Tax=Pseudodonghicola flavimaris TaxID=3050036 RepID=A0ABT7F3C3_9RHOB|nr:hypothetical protein [Pseudodonghicola flavimaris]MDK3019092.1 hypothetical protein [Pseudodonghicola flavimaris]
MTEPIQDPPEHIAILTGAEADTAFEAEWCALFARCYGATEDKGHALFRKYRLNPARFAGLWLGDRLVACYSGLLLDSGIGPVFLATDTMSDGSRGKASVTLGTALYERLAAASVTAVVGYPNENIRHLRQKYLGWTLRGEMNLYVGVPLLWRLGFTGARAEQAGLWQVSRPDSGAFAPLPPLLRLAARGHGYGARRLALTVTLSAARPGPFFLRVPAALVASRQFGYRLLSEDVSAAQMQTMIAALDLDTIDVP